MTRLMMFAASLRKNSDNQKLLQCAKAIARSRDVEVDYADFSEFSLPLYNYDDQTSQGLPEEALDFISRLKKADGLIMAVPEYNHSIPGTLKNLIDWVSREKPMPWDGRNILLMSASPALCGGNRGLWATRIPLECCGAYVFPKMFSLPSSPDAFDENGSFKDSKNDERLTKNIEAFLDLIAK